MRLLLAATLSITLSTSALLLGQQAQSGLALTTKTAPNYPKELLYTHFLHLVANLDKEASAPSQDGKDRKWLGTYLQKHLNLTDDEMKAVRQAAKDLDDETSPIRQEARSIVERDHAAIKANNFDQSNPLPGVNRLKELSQQRIAVTNLVAERMNGKLSNESRARINAFLTGPMTQGMQTHAIGPVHVNPSK